MATQYSLEGQCFSPEFEYQVEELKKKMHGAVANFAQIRFKRAMQMRMTVVDNAR